MCCFTVAKKLGIFFFYAYRVKHPTKVQIWAGISESRSTGICVFEGTIDAPLYTDILQRTLIPFLQTVYPDGQRFMADNDPKHTSRHAKNFLQQNRITWWRTSPESPDLNPIENLWHDLKEFMRREVKPHTKEQLITGIQEFWKTVDATKCKST